MPNTVEIKRGEKVDPKAAFAALGIAYDESEIQYKGQAEQLQTHQEKLKPE